MGVFCCRVDTKSASKALLTVNAAKGFELEGRDTLQEDSVPLRSTPAPPTASRRAPPPTLVRGCTSLLEGIPSSVFVINKMETKKKLLTLKVRH